MPRDRIDLPRLGQRPDAEMDQEIEAHLQLRIDDLVRAGWSPDAARAEAVRRFGGLDRARHDLHRAARRRQAALRYRGWIEALAVDSRFAFRQVLRYRGYSLRAVVMLALGIGLTTAMFTLVERILLRPLPFPNASRLVNFNGRDSAGSDVPVVSSADWQDWQRGARTLESTAIYGIGRRVDVIVADSSTRLNAEDVSAGFFHVLQARFLAGRAFSPDEVQSRAPVVVVSEAVWRNLLGADPLLARPLVTDSRSYTVVGVLAAGAGYPAGTDAWFPVPMTAESGGMRNNVNWVAIGRLAAGATLASATADLDAVSRDIRRSDHAGLYDVSVHVRSLQQLVVGDLAPSFRLLLAAVGCVLLIVCTNLAVATLGRGATRRHEMAIRASLGADRLRLAAQLLTEQVLLALVGGAAGLGLALVVIRGVLAMWGSEIPRAGEVHLDVAVFAFVGLASVAVGVLAGIVPAWRGSRFTLVHALKAGGRTAVAGGRNGGNLFVVLQVALALLLLVGAGLLLRSFRSLLGRDLGFDRHVATVELVLQPGRYADSTRRLLAWDQLMAAYRAIPGVQHVGVANWIPLGMTGSSFIDIEGREGSNDGAMYRAVSEGYFRAMGIPLRAGRTFDGEDGPASARVAVINQAMAKRYWPGHDPVGRLVRARSMEFRPGGEAPWLTIVGVVGDTRQWGLESDPRPEMYTDFRQLPRWTTGMTVVVRSTLPPARIVPLLRARTRTVDPLLAADIGVLDDRLAAQLAPRRLTLLLLTGFAGVALLLAALGIYGVVAWAVTQRARELAVRAALGAQRGTLLAMVLGSGLRTVMLGLGLGVVAAASLGRVLRAMLVDLSPIDPATYLAAVLLLVVVGVSAIAVPAIRATRIDPLVALKGE